MTSWTPQDPKWLYEVDTTLEPPKGLTDEPLLGKAWQRLQVLHTPFRTIDPEEYRWIVDWLRKLEQLFLEDTELEPYYRQCFAPETEPPSWAELSPPPEPPASARIDHIATIQAQFMEEVFYALVLDRHANALDNRGWMNLFRRWGRSKRFNDRLDTIRSLLTLRFLTFYDYYILKYPCRIDEDPIPHPWDSDKRREDPRPRGTVPDRTGGLLGTNPHCAKGDPKSFKPMTPEEAAKAAEASAKAAQASAKAAAEVAKKAAEEAKAAAETARKAAAEAAKKPAEATKKATEAAKKAAEAAKRAAEAAKPLLPGVYLDSGIREAGIRPPPGGADAPPASPRDVPKTEMDRPERPRQEDSGDEPGGSASTTPNK